MVHEFHEEGKWRVQVLAADVMHAYFITVRGLGDWEAMPTTAGHLTGWTTTQRTGTGQPQNKRLQHHTAPDVEWPTKQKLHDDLKTFAAACPKDPSDKPVYLKSPDRSSSLHSVSQGVVMKFCGASKGHHKLPYPTVQKIFGLCKNSRANAVLQRVT